MYLHANDLLISCITGTSELEASEFERKTSYYIETWRSTEGFEEATMEILEPTKRAMLCGVFMQHAEEGTITPDSAFLIVQAVYDWSENDEEMRSRCMSPPDEPSSSSRQSSSRSSSMRSTTRGGKSTKNGLRRPGEWTLDAFLDFFASLSSTVHADDAFELGIFKYWRSSIIEHVWSNGLSKRASVYLTYACMVCDRYKEVDDHAMEKMLYLRMIGISVRARFMLQVSHILESWRYEATSART